MDSILSAAAVRATLLGTVIIGCALAGLGCETAGVRGTPTPTAAAPDSADTTYRLESAQSELHFLVYRAGPFARLGHNHVIAARGLEGRLALTAEVTGSTFELLLPVERLEVDLASLRARYGEEFASIPSAADIAGTRANMLGPDLLDGSAYPFVRVAGQVSRETTGYSAALEIAIKDTVARRTTPVTLTVAADRVAASGSLSIDHTELGLTPFSVLLGALRVAESIEIRFELVATRATPGPAVVAPN